MNDTSLPGSGVATIVGTLVALVVVLLLAYVLLKWMGLRMPGQMRSRHIHILDRVPVASDKTLVLVRVAEKTILVGMSSHSIEKICDIEDPEGVLGQNEDEQKGAFAGLLEQKIKFGFRGKKEGSD